MTFSQMLYKVVIHCLTKLPMVELNPIFRV